MPDLPTPPRWTVDYSDEDLAGIAADTQWWAATHRRQAAAELARRRRRLAEVPDA